MERVPARHKRATGTLNEAARARLWGWAGASAGGGGGSSSGSERSAEEGSLELDDLLFDSLYGDEGEIDGDEDLTTRRSWREPGCGGRRDAGAALGWSEREMLEGLVSLSRRDRLGGRIRTEAEVAWRSMGTDLGAEGCLGWKRRLMWRLRDKGFDAGLCKCQCEMATRFPAVAHEYVDVVADGGAARYIVQPNLAAEFEIARPTPSYRALLDALPAVFVGRPEVLSDVVRVMCRAAAESMKSQEMHMPPWRRREYVQGKWLGPYKRTTGRDPNGGGPAPASYNQLGVSNCRREDCGRREGLKGRKVAVGL